MSGLYTSLQVSPRKKRCPPEEDDETTFTPKKLRTAPPTPPPTKPREGVSSKPSLPTSLSRLYNLQTALQHALSHALATCAISPTSDSGVVRSVLNHISIVTYSGFSTTFEVEDLKRLCWLWEWDGKALPGATTKQNVEDEDNPFLDSSASIDPPAADWTRGSMGIIVCAATHYSKKDRKRVPAYGIGIEVEMDIDKDMLSGIAAVARWTAMAEKRRFDFLAKLELWVEFHKKASSIPSIPLANIPELASPRPSALTRTLASCSPSAISPSLLPGPPPSPSRSPAKKPTRDFSTISFPTLGAISPTKKSAPLFPQTPSRHDRADAIPGSAFPQTPSMAASSPSKEISEPFTPVRQKGSNDTPAQTPSSRRQALLERVRQRSLSSSPTKTPHKSPLATQALGSGLTKDQMLKMSQDALRRRCLLGRLGGVAESIWMLFANPVSGGSSTPSRKRRALPWSDVSTAVIKSSPVPISTAEANESITMLLDLCPFFLKKLDFSGSEWLQMPAAASPSDAAGSADPSPTKPKSKAFLEPPSPGRIRGKDDSAQELLNRSPRRVKREGGGLREVREIIRRELEIED